MAETTMPDTQLGTDPRAISNEFAGEAEADNPVEDER